jgi:hypothetical protein
VTIYVLLDYAIRFQTDTNRTGWCSGYAADLYSGGALLNLAQDTDQPDYICSRFPLILHEKCRANVTTRPQPLPLKYLRFTRHPTIPSYRPVILVIEHVMK